MGSSGALSLLLILINAYVTYKGLSNALYLNKYAFNISGILGRKEYKRLITSGFLHVSWIHFIFNMVSLQSFGAILEEVLGPLNFLLIYFGSLLGGSLFSLYINRNDKDYSAVGASGAVSGIIFSTIALWPSGSVSLLFIPAPIPGWLFALMFVLFSLYGIKTRLGNIGHEAHLGGALFGLLITAGLRPEVILENYLTLLLIIVPSAIFMYLVIRKPYLLLINNYSIKENNYFDVEDKHSLKKKSRQDEIDRILDKIGTKGIESLSQREKDILDKYSR
jgi:membrane associated rhomboid family serine protease